MNFLRTSNPTLRPDVFAPAQTWKDAAGAADKPRTMTLQGTINASLVLIGLCGGTAVASWSWLGSNPNVLYPAFLGSALIGFVLALVICFKRTTAPYLAPIYAVLEGVFVAGASIVWANYASQGKGGALAGSQIVLQAGLLTFGIAAAMLIAYATRLIKPSQKLLAGIAAATIGVCLFFLAAFVLSMFGVNVGSLWSGKLGIVIAAVVVVIAAANLIIDFAIVEDGVNNGAPRYMEWYAGFGLLVTLVWLYVSLLRLLAILANRR